MSDDDELDSLKDLAKQALDNILNLSRSQQASEKLQGLNILLFSFSLSLTIISYLGGIENKGLSFIVVIILAEIFSLIIANGYAIILEILVNFTEKKIEALRISITLLFISILLGITSVIFNIPIILSVSQAFIIIQLFIIPLAGPFVPESNLLDHEINFSQLWGYLNRIDIILGIITALYTIYMVLIGAG